MKRFVELHSRNLCLALALVISVILSVHIIRAPVLPIADGQGYAMRAFALYGFIHAGQWSHFWHVLNHPAQSIFPLHNFPFLLLPPALAQTAAYVLLQNTTTHLLLAYAVFKVCRVLNRPGWAPSIFLLCSFNNVVWTDFYAFFLDMQFCALGLLVIAFQMKAWKGNRPAPGVLSGFGLGLLFWLKPANALIFLATYFLSELFHAGNTLRRTKKEANRRSLFLSLGTDWSRKLMGFAPSIFLAFVCGGAQSVLQLIDQNEIHEFSTPLACGGLLRLFYFPLCLSAFYHVLLLGSLLLAAMVLGRSIPSGKIQPPPAPFAAQLFLPVAFAYLVFGGFFSFFMLVKPVRALLLMVPLLWIAVSWLWEKRRLRSEFLLLVAVLYVCAFFCQKAFDVFGTRDLLVEDNYQLEASSWMRMPSPWRRGASLNQVICDSISRDLPPSAIICVNSIEVRNALAWRLENEFLLRAQTPPYEVRNLLDFKAEYFAGAMLGANRIALITFPAFQTSRAAWLETMGILGYGQEEWCGPKTLAQLRDLPSIGEEPIGHEFVFAHPLTAADVASANQSAPFVGLARADNAHVKDTIYGRHFSRAEARQLLQAWFDKRFN